MMSLFTFVQERINMSQRTTEAVFPPQNPHFVGDGFRVHNFIPSYRHLSMQRMSPFIMLDYGSKFHFPPSDKPRGVGVHPHRGFETVTIAYKGRVAHHDSAGNSGVIGEGDVQWMTAASGVLHKEYHEETFTKSGGDFQMVQLWVNLPAKDKMSKPKYQEITKSTMKVVNLGEGSLEIIAGEYKGAKGPASTFTPVHIYNIRLKKGASAEINLPSDFNTAMLAVEGQFTINNSDTVPTDHFALMRNDGETFTVTGVEDTLILLLSGQPIHEPIAAHGPFVMNTREEIIEAFTDFEAGKFGHLE
jgi:redox-sensitive bicupin YhaK (pirin superfamily)